MPSVPNPFVNFPVGHSSIFLIQLTTVKCSLYTEKPYTMFSLDMLDVRSSFNFSKYVCSYLQTNVKINGQYTLGTNRGNDQSD